MVKRIAQGMANYYSRKNVITDDDVDVYSYGFELVISSVLNLVFVFAAAIALGITLQASAFVLSFALIRAFGGGYHAKTHRGCILAFLVVFLAFAYALRYLPESAATVYMLSATGVSSLIICAVAPVEAKNKPLSEAKRNRLKTICIIISFAYVSVVVYRYFAHRLDGKLLVYAISGKLAASASMALAFITRRISSAAHDN